MAGHEEPFRRGSWPFFAFDDFSPPHTGSYLPLEKAQHAGYKAPVEKWDTDSDSSDGSGDELDLVV